MLPVLARFGRPRPIPGPPGVSSRYDPAGNNGIELTYIFCVVNVSYDHYTAHSGNLFCYVPKLNELRYARNNTSLPRYVT